MPWVCPLCGYPRIVTKPAQKRRDTQPSSHTTSSSCERADLLPSRDRERRVSPIPQHSRYAPSPGPNVDSPLLHGVAVSSSAFDPGRRPTSPCILRLHCSQKAMTMARMRDWRRGAAPAGKGKAAAVRHVSEQQQPMSTFGAPLQGTYLLHPAIEDAPLSPPRAVRTYALVARGVTSRSWPATPTAVVASRRVASRRQSSQNAV